MIHLTHSNESKSINDDADNDGHDDDDDEQPADKVLGGGGERPLGEKLPNGFEVNFKKVNFDGFGHLKLTGAIELHRLVLLKDYDQLKKRKEEITSTIINTTCAVDHYSRGIHGGLKEVSQPPLPLFRRSRHCGWHARKETQKQHSCF